jgi:lantibiotic modifying enzyme
VLYSPEAHEPLTERPWDGGGVRQAIARIVEDVDSAYAPGALWPAEDWDAWDLQTPLTGLYVGAAGVVWALDTLRRRGLAATRLDLSAVAEEALERWRATPEISPSTPMPDAAEAGLLSGETGLLVVAWRVGVPGLEGALEQRLVESRASEADEIMWGSPGTLLAAAAMRNWTRDERWDEAWRGIAEALWQRRDADGLWTQDIYGSQFQGLGTAHGLVGNVVALLGGGGLSAERRAGLIDDTTAVLVRTAVIDDGLVNWPPVVGDAEEKFRLQWCHGAPGIVTSAAEYLPEELLLGGSELTWQAGPLGMEKGAGLCHGTAGNGYVFLNAFERTGDELWLERARRFCVHALEQVERRGHGRYSLWTGDVGVALYAAACLDPHSAYPIMDGWD